MEIKPIKFYNTFSFRLSCIVTLVVTIIFAILVININTKVKQNLNNESVLRTQNSINMIVAEINQLVETTHQVAVNAEWSLVNEFGEVSGDNNDLSYIPYSIVKNNNWIAGAVLTVVPGAIPNRPGAFSAIAYTDTLGAIVTKPLDYDYTQADWWKEPLQNNNDSWSEPFRAAVMGSMITSFSHIIRDERTGKPMAMLTVDLKLDDLDTLLKHLQPYPKAFTILLSAQGRYIVHPQHSLLLQTSDNATSFLNKDNYEFDTLGDMMQITRFKNESQADYSNRFKFFCTEIKQTGWSVVIACPVDEVYAKAQQAMQGLTRLFFICLFVLVLFSFGVSHYATRPIRIITKGINKIASGDYHSSLPPVKGSGEVQQVRESFNTMQQSLIDNMAKLTESTKAQERVNSELSIAKSIQQNLLTKSFSPYVEWPNLELYALLQPALEVGGDLYDFFIRDRKLFFTIGDVSGKGIPAALFMAITRGLFRVIAYNENSPAVIANRINRTLAAENSENMFVTMIIGVLNLDNGKLALTNAGHNAPIVLHADKENNFLKTKINLPIGVMEEVNYGEEYHTLTSGDTMVLYTDGITEAENKQTELFGNDRLINAIHQNRELSPKEMVSTIMDQVHHFATGTKQSDDITILTLRLKYLIN